MLKAKSYRKLSASKCFLWPVYFMVNIQGICCVSGILTQLLRHLNKAWVTHLSLLILVTVNLKNPPSVFKRHIPYDPAILLGIYSAFLERIAQKPAHAKLFHAVFSAVANIGNHLKCLWIDHIMYCLASEKNETDLCVLKWCGGLCET